MTMLMHLIQRYLEPSKTNHRQGCHIGQMGLQSEIETQWSSRKMQSTLCGKKFQLSGRTRLFWDYSVKQGHVKHQFDIKTVALPNRLKRLSETATRIFEAMIRWRENSMPIE